MNSKIKLIYFLTATLLLSAWGCSDDDDFASSISLSESEIRISGLGGVSAIIKVETDAPIWSAVADDAGKSWYSVVKTDDHSFSVVAEPNPGSERTGTVTVSAHGTKPTLVTVTQNGASIITDVKSFEYGFDDQTLKTVRINTNAANWSAVAEDYPWIIIDQDNEAGTFTVAVEYNEERERTGTISVTAQGGETVEVSVRQSTNPLSETPWLEGEWSGSADLALKLYSTHMYEYEWNSRFYRDNDRQYWISTNFGNTFNIYSSYPEYQQPLYMTTQMDNNGVYRPGVVSGVFVDGWELEYENTFYGIPKGIYPIAQIVGYLINSEQYRYFNHGDILFAGTDNSSRLEIGGISEVGTPYMVFCALVFDRPGTEYHGVPVLVARDGLSNIVFTKNTTDATRAVDATSEWLPSYVRSATSEAQNIGNLSDIIFLD